MTVHGSRPVGTARERLEEIETVPQGRHEVRNVVEKQCGEPLFEEQEVEAIQDIVKAVDEKCRLLQRS